MEIEAAKMIGAGIACFGMAGAAIGVGMIFSSFLGGALRNPSAAQDNFSSALIGGALAEALGIFSFLIAILMLFVV